jgi:hypothetical protein
MNIKFNSLMVDYKYRELSSFPLSLCLIDRATVRNASEASAFSDATSDKAISF